MTGVIALAAAVPPRNNWKVLALTVSVLTMVIVRTNVGPLAVAV